MVPLPMTIFGRVCGSSIFEELSDASSSFNLHAF